MQYSRSTSRHHRAGGRHGAEQEETMSGCSHWSSGIHPLKWDHIVSMTTTNVSTKTTNY
ncbi:hypothetical protein DPMN_168976 [Dreissena polymorpha]|uniref:Uncharacterized protein n=1 Tax=Dreissena polymorpha TaxID=45954 RepID=A0A9D4F3T3_DREPO|nr:hypothetical protein DPMN_168976 [Dreissena polymorpha]